MGANWRKIKTAPKDGTVVVLYCPAGVERQNYDTDPPYTIGYFGKSPHIGGKSSWYSVETIMEYHDYGGMTGVSTWTETICVEPTHWMPLPQPPQVEKE
jgi:hypothetical protein